MQSSEIRFTPFVFIGLVLGLASLSLSSALEVRGQTSTTSYFPLTTSKWTIRLVQHYLKKLLRLNYRKVLKLFKRPSLTSYSECLKSGCSKSRKHRNPDRRHFRLQEIFSVQKLDRPSCLKAGCISML